MHWMLALAVVLPQDSTHRDTIVLKPIEILGTLSSTAAPRVGSGVPAHITTITGAEIGTWQPRSLAYAVAGSAGVSVYDDLGSPFKISLTSRGFTAGPAIGLPQGISVFVDGVRQNEPDAAQVNFDLLPLEHVERVEFLHGPAALLGPNSLGGAINLVTKRGGGPLDGELEVSGGSFGEVGSSFSAGGRLRQWSYYVGGSVDREDGWREATDGQQRQLLINLGHYDVTRGLSMQLLGSSDRTREAGSLPESLYIARPRTNFTPGDFDHLALLQGTVSGYAPMGGGRISLSLYHRRMDGDRFNVNQVPDPNVTNANVSRAVGMNVEWLRQGSFGAVRGGIDANAHDVSVQLHAQDQTRGTDSLTTWVKSPGWDLAGYAVGDLVLGRATASAGLRYDVVRVPFRDQLDPTADTTSTFTHVSARGGVAYDLGAGSSMYASAGKSFRAPALLELSCADPAAPCPLPFALGDDPPLRPVVATTLETGVHWSQGSRAIDASLYRTAVHDDIFFVAPGSAQGYFANLAATRRVGLELGVQTDIASRMTLRASYAYTRATFASRTLIATVRVGADTVRVGDRFPLTPEHRGAIAASWRISQTLQVDVQMGFTGRQFLRGDEANETTRLPDYTTVDGRMAWRWKGWDVAGMVLNAFDRRYASFGTWGTNRTAGDRVERFRTPGAPRAFRLMLRHDLGGSNRT
ncbi:MAG: TonB-dependent receptor [Gemmatimonadales bacterium]